MLEMLALASESRRIVMLEGPGTRVAACSLVIDFRIRELRPACYFSVSQIQATQCVPQMPQSFC